MKYICNANKRRLPKVMTFKFIDSACRLSSVVSAGTNSRQLNFHGTQAPQAHNQTFREPWSKTKWLKHATFQGRDHFKRMGYCKSA
jgi:hypothetical protein